MMGKTPLPGENCSTGTESNQMKRPHHNWSNSRFLRSFAPF